MVLWALIEPITCNLIYSLFTLHTQTVGYDITSVVVLCLTGVVGSISTYHSLQVQGAIRKHFSSITVYNMTMPGITSYLPSWLVHPYQLDESISFLGCLLNFFIFILFWYEIPVSKQCRLWPDFLRSNWSLPFHLLYTICTCPISGTPVTYGFIINRLIGQLGYILFGDVSIACFILLTWIQSILWRQNALSL